MHRPDSRVAAISSLAMLLGLACVSRGTSDAGDVDVLPFDPGSSLDGGADAGQPNRVCTHAAPPGPSTWELAKKKVPVCAGPGVGHDFTYAVRCGAYDGLVDWFLDSGYVYFYDSMGALVGFDNVGLSTLGCVSEDPSFVSPVVNWTLVGCTKLEVPTCSDGGTLDDGG